MLKVWNSMDHRATMDIDLLGRTSNQIHNLQRIISEVAAITCEEDGIKFDTQRIILRRTQTAGEYEGVSVNFSAQLYSTKMPVLIDIGFNDIIIPNPQTIQYPTLLDMPEPTLLGYTIETVIAEKFESIVKLALLNTRMKDFYDLWTLLSSNVIPAEKLKTAIKEVFTNRKTNLKHPIAFTSAFYNSTETKKRWNNFLFNMRKDQIELEEVVKKIAHHLSFLKY